MKMNLAVLLLVTAVVAPAALQGRPRASDPDRGVHLPAMDARTAEREAAEREREARWEFTRYRGLSVSPQLGAEGDDLELQTSVGRLMTTLDLVPNPRVEHFRWLAESGEEISGWRGAIEETATVPGGVRIKLKVHPRLVGGGQVADNVHEFYLISADRIQFLGMEAGICPLGRGATAY